MRAAEQGPLGRRMQVAAVFLAAAGGAALVLALSNPLLRIDPSPAFAACLFATFGGAVCTNWLWRFAQGGGVRGRVALSSLGVGIALVAVFAGCVFMVFPTTSGMPWSWRFSRTLLVSGHLWWRVGMPDTALVVAPLGAVAALIAGRLSHARPA